MTRLTVFKRCVCYGTLQRCVRRLQWIPNERQRKGDRLYNGTAASALVYFCQINVTLNKKNSTRSESSYQKVHILTNLARIWDRLYPLWFSYWTETDTKLFYIPTLYGGHFCLSCHSGSKKFQTAVYYHRNTVVPVLRYFVTSSTVNNFSKTARIARRTNDFNKTAKSTSLIRLSISVRDNTACSATL